MTRKKEGNERAFHCFPFSSADDKAEARRNKAALAQADDLKELERRGIFPSERRLNHFPSAQAGFSR